MAQRRPTGRPLPEMPTGRLCCTHNHLRPYVWLLFGVLACVGDEVRKILLDPKFFNYVIISLYALSALRWGYEKRWADMCYWLSALAITLTVTFGYKH